MKNNHSRSASGGGFMRTISAQSGRVAGDVQELGRVAVDGAGRAVAKLRRKGREALKAARRAKGQVGHYFTANPVKSVLMAMGVGALLGFLLRRRS